MKKLILILFVVLKCCSPALAQDKKISQLPALPSVSGSELIPLAKSGLNYYTTPNQIKGWLTPFLFDSTKFIPRSGTYTAYPLTGTIEFDNSISGNTTFMYQDISTGQGIYQGMGDNEDLSNADKYSMSIISPTSYNIQVNDGANSTTFSAGVHAVSMNANGANGVIFSVSNNVSPGTAIIRGLNSSFAGIQDYADPSAHYTSLSHINKGFAASHYAPISYTNSVTNSNAPLSITNNTISISQSNTSTDGYLSSTDWNIFNNKQTALSGTGFVYQSGSTTSYTPTIPNSGLDNSTISGVSLGSNLFNLSTGYGLSGSSYNGSSAISWLADTGSTNGLASKLYVTAKLAGKQSTLVSGTNIKTVAGVSLLGSGDVGIIGGTYGGTGVNNGANTITLAGNLTTTGAFNTSLTQQATTTVTLPAVSTTLVGKTGSNAATQISYFSDGNQVTSNSNFTYNSAASGAPFINLNATLPNVTSSYGMLLNMTGTGSTGTAFTSGIRVFMNPGYTGGGATAASSYVNQESGTGANLQYSMTVATPLANLGQTSFSFGSTAGYNIGSFNEASGSSVLNIGNYGKSCFSGSSNNVGIYGQSASGTNDIGGFFYLGNSSAPSVSLSGAIVADNGASGLPIIVGRTNSATSFGVYDKGKTFIGGSTSPTAILHLTAGTSTANTAPLKLTVASSVLLGTIEAGAVETNTTGALFYSPTTSNRYQIGMTLVGNATLDFPSTAAGTTSDLTITVTGAADGDPVSLGVPNGSEPATGSLYTWRAWVSSSNTVTVRLINMNTITAIDPASGTFKVSVNKN